MSDPSITPIIPFRIVQQPSNKMRMLPTIRVVETLSITPLSTIPSTIQLTSFAEGDGKKRKMTVATKGALKDEIAKLKDDNKALQYANSILTADLHSTLTEIEQLKKCMTASAIENAELRNKHKEKGEEIAKLQDENKEIRDKIEQCKGILNYPIIPSTSFQSTHINPLDLSLKSQTEEPPAKRSRKNPNLDPVLSVNEVYLLQQELNTGMSAKP